MYHDIVIPTCHTSLGATCAFTGWAQLGDLGEVCLHRGAPRICRFPTAGGVPWLPWAMATGHWPCGSPLCTIFGFLGEMKGIERYLKGFSTVAQLVQLRRLVSRIHAAVLQDWVLTSAICDIIRRFIKRGCWSGNSLTIQTFKRAQSSCPAGCGRPAIFGGSEEHSRHLFGIQTPEAERAGEVAGRPTGEFTTS